MAISKVERLMNLVIALLSTKSFITAERIRKTVSGYGDSPSDEAFSRMFERDKNELRDLGIPLETGRVSRLDPTEGYRINREAYRLPPVELTPDEAAAVALATQLWESPEMVTTTQSALLKLRAAGVDVEAPDGGQAVSVSSAASGLRGSEEVLGELLAAIDAGRAVRFDHRATRGEPFTERTLEPWGVITYRGRWYVVGHDRDRDDTRTFRLSRIGAGVRAVGPSGVVSAPAEVDLRDVVHRAVAQWPPGEPARVWVAEGRGTALRRQAGAAVQRALDGRPGDELTLEVGMADALAREIAGLGADAVALDPPWLRENVLARLRAAADRQVVGP